MSILDNKKSKKAPWHLWMIGIVGLFWNAMGALDYVMSQTKNEDYMSAFTPEQLAFFYGLPTLIVATWAIAVWGGVLGSILLLMRKTLAVWVFFTSLICMLITAVHNYGFSNGLEVIGDTFSLVFTGVIFLSAFALYWYARVMQQKHFLD